MFRLASRRGNLTRLPVATDLLDGAPSLPATSMPRRLLSARLGISDVSRTPSCADVVTIRQQWDPGDNVVRVVQLRSARGLFWCGSFGSRGAQPGRIARDVHRLSSRPKCEARRAGIHRETVALSQWVPDSAARFRDDNSCVLDVRGSRQIWWLPPPSRGCAAIHLPRPSCGGGKATDQAAR